MFLRDFGEKKYHHLFYAAIEEMGPYEVVQLLGRGSYGFAYLIQNKVTNEKFVLKRLRRKHVKKKKIMQNFQQEITFLQKEMHPNIPVIKEVGNIAGIPYFSMDYIDGKTFEEIIFGDGISFSIEESINVIGRLLEMVIILHSHGIVHRDLRIPNILLRNNELVIIDFGLACYEDPKCDYKQVKNPKKAPSYISDLYNIGHFLLFLLYSNYTPTNKKERSWQEELQLPIQVQNYLEKLLLLQPPFLNAQAAYDALYEIHMK
ncbi:serine/threonine protein kinase [Bacillus massiliigorillae]|uniref:serine/threonine protein kinase n=1 Tax=Bacillus massiliigorillae TaxID=1243664 RepID=UPI00039B5D3A|nr:protein kinase [Bacillus massiliigorillae]